MPEEMQNQVTQCTSNLAKPANLADEVLHGLSEFHLDGDPDKIQRRSEMLVDPEEYDLMATLIEPSNSWKLKSGREMAQRALKVFPTLKCGIFLRNC